MTNINYNRYSRQIILEDIGTEGQKKLQSAKILVVGAGGLGCPVLQYLAAAGVGNIGIVDDDIVELNNLQRQVLYNTSDVGKLKTEIAKEKVKALNPEISIKVFNTKIRYSNALEIVKNYDIIVDCTDNFNARYTINDVCVITDKIIVYGALHKYEGQIAVFNYQNGPSYRCLFPSMPKDGSIPNCAETGVLGVVPGIIGSMQANEVLKLILGIGNPMSKGILIYNTHSNETNFISVNRDENEILKILDMKEKFNTSNTEEKSGTINKSKSEIKLIGAEEVAIRLLSGFNAQFIDVRDLHETPEIAEIEAMRIPLNELQDNLDKIDPDSPILICCQSGTRSKIAANLLQTRFNQSEIYSISGGMLALVNYLEEETVN